MRALLVIVLIAVVVVIVTVLVLEIVLVLVLVVVLMVICRKRSAIERHKVTPPLSNPPVSRRLGY